MAALVDPPSRHVGPWISSVAAASVDVLFQELCRLIEAELLRQGVPVEEACTIRRVSAMEPYLAHYTRELAAYAELQEGPGSAGFFAPERPPVDLEGRGWERACLVCPSPSLLTVSQEFLLPAPSSTAFIVSKVW